MSLLNTPKSKTSTRKLFGDPKLNSLSRFNFVMSTTMKNKSSGSIEQLAHNLLTNESHFRAIELHTLSSDFHGRFLRSFFGILYSQISSASTRIENSEKTTKNSSRTTKTE